MDFKKEFKNKLKEKTKGLEIQNSSPLTFFEQISEEINSEINRNPTLKFKKSLTESKNEIKHTASISGLFDLLEQTKEDLKELIQEEPPEIILEEVFVEKEELPAQDLISLAMNSISKEESSKPFQEHTNLFSQPDVSKPDPNIKGLQNKIKFLEDWLTKISMAGPGSGEVNFRWLDDVNRNSIGNTDQILRYNPVDKKFFFGQLSGDQGPIKSLNFDNTGISISPTPGTLSWNTAKDCLDIYQADNSTLQVGLENYFRVHNSSANTLHNGTIVQFSGVNGGGETPTVSPLIANSSAIPLYTMGMLTGDILPGQNGRATILGEVHDLNTTGSEVGEVWTQGDLLWSSPTNPGKLTKVKPTAPDVVIYIGAVIKVDNIDGIILIKPAIFPRLYYGSFYDITNQTISANTINTPVAVRYSNTQISSGFHIANNSQIVAERAGLYNYQFSLQVDSTTAASGKQIWIWYRKNGLDVPWSTTTITVNKEFKVAAWNFIESMHIGEYFELMWAANDENIKIVAPTGIGFAPEIPSIIMTVSQVNL